MNKVTIITGPSNSGKSWKARELIQGKKNAVVYDPGPSGWFGVTPETEIVHVEMGYSSSALTWLKAIVTEKRIKVSKDRNTMISIPRPELVIALQGEYDWGLSKNNPRYELIELKRGHWLTNEAE